MLTPLGTRAPRLGRSQALLAEMENDGYRIGQTLRDRAKGPVSES